jgi:Fe-S oxidoreductase/FAD/FMN-containing dehydrogenase
MNGSKTPVLNDIEERFGERMSGDEVERYIYSRDMGEFPSIIGKVVGGLADVVVQVKDSEELAWVLDFARCRRMPVTPRGAATSGYGGAIPVNGGIVVDLTRMNHILEIDTDGKEVAVEAGVVWWNLEKKLRERGLALKAYPSSAPSSTVGGWIAEGGSGIGAYRYGGIEDNLLELKVVTPEGKKSLSGQDMELYVGSEGILGFITEARISVRKATDDKPFLFAFEDTASTQSFIDSLKGSGLAIFHLQAITPQLAALKNEVSDDPYLPEEKYLVLMVLEGPETEAAAELAARAGGRALSAETAAREWEERLYPMRVKKAGPSLVPAEAEVPTAEMGALLRDANKRLKDLALEAVVGRDGMSVFLGFIPSDARDVDFLFQFPASLEFLRLAEKHYGAPYGIGLYFVDRAVKRLGKSKKRLLEEAKKQTDPYCLLNPGKILTSCADAPRLKALRGMMLGARLSLPVALPAGKLAPHTRVLRKRLPEKVEQAAYTCAQCGYCKEGCTLFAGREWESASPRGKMQYLRGLSHGEVPLTEEMSDTFLLCTTCKKCDLACQTDIAIESIWEEMRGHLIASGKYPTFPPFEMMGAAYSMENNIWAGLASERDAWLPDDIKPLETGEIGFWAGCTASYIEQDIARGAVRILKEGGIDFAYLGNEETCCGVPFLMSGKWDVFEKAVRRNIEAINKRGIKTLYASCPGCWVTLGHHYKDWAGKLGLEWNVQVRHIAQLAAEMVREGKLEFKKDIPMKITWHDPCHIGRHGGIYEEPREVLRAIPGIELYEMEHNREDALCCGGVLTLIGETRPTSGRIADKRLQEARDAGAEAIVTTCPCCEFQLRVWNQADGNGMQIIDFASIVSEALGGKLEDPDHVVRDSWAVFDVMIQLMSPQGMADFMWEFMEGVSRPLAGAMRAFRKLPRPALNAMFFMADRAMPLMVPKMLPVLMPWMLPRMMPLMEAKMPAMSDSMKQLMPEILPKVMDRIMPYMMPRIMRCMLG